jgi:ribonucleotide reductase alpha subunit|tara:strand:- start:746 stop:4414 length:3669 start_codon:yes stop_codon:yes gene_type:complete
MTNNKSNVIDMHVLKRSGKKEAISFDKILKRIKLIGKDLELKNVIYGQLAMKVIDQLKDNIRTTDIDELTAEQCASMGSVHPDYTKLASAITISNLHKNTVDSFYETIKKLYEFVDVNNNNYKLIHEDVMKVVEENKHHLDTMVDYKRDFLFDYFGFKTLERAYLLKVNGVIVERPQHMWMRVSICIHGGNIEKVKETYDYMSNKFFIHATPTLFNAGTPRPQLSSCYLLSMEDDSIDGIFNTVKECAQISKWSGGIGLHIHNVRSSGSHIRGTNGTSNGIIPMLGVFNKTARYVDQGGKRNGSFAIYLEPHHPDIEEFLELRKNHGDEESKARDLFYAIWASDLFMERVMGNKIWSLFCPDKCPGLSDAYGDKYRELYMKYEEEGKYNKQLNARDLWLKILDAQMETGTPYILYKDACNEKSNQKNLGTIKSSNLCCVEGNTKILTDKGHLPIKDLVNQKVNIWNGEEFSESDVFKTNDADEVITICFTDGVELECTNYHKFRIYDLDSNGKVRKNYKTKDVEVRDLKIGDKLVKCDFPVIDNDLELKFAYTNGFFSGDGTYSYNKNDTEKPCSFKVLKGHKTCKRHLIYENLIENNIDSEKCQAKSYKKNPIVSLYGEKIRLLQYLEYNSHEEEKDNKLQVTLTKELKEKFYVPINYSLKSKLDWFAGYCDADGCIIINNGCQCLQIACIHKDFLNKIKLMLQTCGINSKVVLNMNSRKTLLPDGNGGQKEFKCKTLYRILIASNELQKLLNLGLSCKRLIINKRESQRNASKFIEIKEITNTGKICETFCFNEPKKNMGIFNGVYSHNCEIVEYSDDSETAVCNLASIGLSMFVKEDKTFDYDKLYEVTKVLVTNLNNIIDINFYPNEKTRKSNYSHRPIGIGVQGLADTFFKMDLAFISDEAKEVNKLIFETIYYAALERSYEISYERMEGMNYLASEYGYENWNFTSNEPYCRNYEIYNITEASIGAAIATDNRIAEYLNKYKPIKAEIDNLKDDLVGAYSSFMGSPISEGLFQFNLWNAKAYSNRYDWNGLKEQIMKYGIRNSLLCAPMPTASTSQILGNNECFEPITSNIYSRKTLAGEFVMINKYLVEELLELKLWNEEIKNNIIANKGSIQYIDGLPEHLKEKYKIVWEMPMKNLIDMAHDRGLFICQSQSMNLWMEDPEPKSLTNMHFYSWRAGLKTGIYYLRRKPKHQAQQFTIEPEKRKDNDEGCLMCSG